MTISGIGALADEAKRLREENARLKDAIRWALGETDFDRPEGVNAPFWWRPILRQKAGMFWNLETKSFE